jgi:hypothetical protein
LGSGLFRVLVYSGFWFIQDSGLFRVWFIQDSGLFRILVYSGFWFIQESGLFRVLVYSGFSLDKFYCIYLFIYYSNDLF